MPNIRHCLAVTLILALFAPPVLSYAALTSYIFSSYQTSDGLSHSAVNSIIEDRSGFLWLGTREGLSRFDGYRFVGYGEHELLDQEIVSLAVDAADRLWVLTPAGVMSLAADRKTFHTLQSLRWVGLQSEQVSALAADADGNLWFASKLGLDFVRVQKQQFNHYPMAMLQQRLGLSAKLRVNALLPVEDGVWLGTTASGLIYLPHHGDPVRLSADSGVDSRRLSSNTIAGITSGKDGTIWASTARGLNRIDSQSLVVERIFAGRSGWNLSDNQLGAVFVDSDDRVWLSAASAVNVLEPQAESFRQISGVSSSSLGSGLLDNQITALWQDQSGSVWLGSARGLSKYNPKAQVIHIYQVAENAYVQALVQRDRDHVWLSNGAALYQLNLSDGTSSEQQLPASFYENLKLVGALERGLNAQLWLGTNDGIYSYDWLLDEWSEYSLPDDASQRVSVLQRGQQGELYVGTYGSGAWLLDPQTRVFSRLPIPEDSQVLALASGFDSDNAPQLWVGTLANGVHQLDLASGSVRDLPPQFADLRQVESIYSGKDDSLYLGSRDGLLVHDFASNSSESYDKTNGLSSNVVTNVGEDSSGRLVVTTINGIDYWDQQAAQFVHYDQSDGLLSTNFIPNTSLQLGDDSILLGTDSGLVRFAPGQYQANELAPQIHLGSLSVNGEVLPYSSAQQLSADQNNISLAILPVHLSSGADLQIAWRLQGLESDWQHSNRAGLDAISYPSLPAGEYQLEVRAANSDGVWSASQELSFAISSPWWLTPWAFGAYLATIALLVVASFKLARRLSQRREQLLEQLVRERTAEIERGKAELVAKSEEISQQARQIEHNANQFGVVNRALGGVFSEQLGLIGSLFKLNGLNDSPAVVQRAYAAYNQLAELTRQITGLLSASKSNAEEEGADLVYSPAALLYQIVDSCKAQAEQVGVRLNARLDKEVEYLPMAPEACQMLLSNLLGLSLQAYQRAQQRPSSEQHYNGTQQVVISISKRSGLTTLNYSDDASAHQGSLKNSKVQSEGQTADVQLAWALLQQLAANTKSSLQVRQLSPSGLKLSLNFALEAAVGSGRVAKIGPENHFNAQYLRAEERKVNNEDLALLLSGEDQEKGEPNRRVLLIEDDQQVHLQIANALEDSECYRCISYYSGTEALKYLKDSSNYRNTSPRDVADAILLDATIPDIKLLELLKGIKQFTQEAIPIIVLAGGWDPRLNAQLYANGVVLVLPKPVDCDELVAALGLHISNSEVTDSGAEGDKIFGAMTTSGTNGRASSPAEQDFINRFMTEIEANYSDPDYRLEMLGKALHKSTRQAQRHINKTMKSSFSTFLRQFRLDKAKQKLKDGNNPSQVANEVGFNSHPYFSRCFKEAFNLSPSEYKRKVRGAGYDDKLSDSGAKD